MKNLYLAFFMSMGLYTASAQVGSLTENFSVSSVVGFYAAEEMGAVHIQFKSVVDPDLSYEVQRSSNGIDFLPLGTLSTPFNSKGDFLYTDATPLNGTNYYRIRTVTFGERKIFSIVRKVELGKDRVDVILTPNPVVTRQLNIQLKNFASGEYSIELFNSAGVKVFTQSFSQTAGDNSQVINLPVGVAAGVYTLNVGNRHHKINKTIQVIR